MANLKSLAKDTAIYGMSSMSLEGSEYFIPE